MTFYDLGLNKKYIEYALFSLEEKENDFILSPNNRKIYLTSEANDKINKLKQTIESSNKNISKSFLSENDYNLFHDFAISKGGFVNMKFRKEIYKKLLYYSNQNLLQINIPNNKSKSNNKINQNIPNNNNQSNTTSISVNNNNNLNYNNNINTNTYFIGPYYIPLLRYFRNVWINKSSLKIFWTNNYLYQYMNPLKDRQIIKVDIERSNINFYFPYNLYPSINNLLKRKAEFAINTIITFNKNEFKYYQGYHDIFMLFFYLYLDSPYTYISLFQRFSEFNIKEFLMIPNNTKKLKKGFSYPNCIKFCLSIIQELNEIVYNELIENCNNDCTFIIPYIICLFMHNINSIFLKYRLLDYFIVSHPISVYIMTSLIIIDEVSKIKIKNDHEKMKQNICNIFTSDNKELTHDISEINRENFYIHFQNLNLDEIDFEKYIERTEEEFKKLNLDKIREKFLSKEFEFKEYYPSINKEKYLKKLIRYDYDKENDPGYSFISNLIYNSRIVKYIVENSKTIYQAIKDKINNSKVYITCNKIFPYAFFCSSILILPSMYFFKNKLK